MRALVGLIKSLKFLHFAEDNHVIPVFRLGRYHRAGGPGFFWTIPLLERTLPTVKTSIYVGDFYFEELLSQDNIPFSLKATVLYTFDPKSAIPAAAAQLVQGGDSLLHVIVRDYANQGLRRLAAKFKAEDLSSSEARFKIERNLTRFLTAEMRALGLAPLKNGGVLLKEVIGHEKFRRAMLDVKRLDANLQVVTSYQAVGDLIQQAIQAGFVSNLEELQGNLTLLSTLSPLESVQPQQSFDIHQALPHVNGRHFHQNGN